LPAKVGHYDRFLQVWVRAKKGDLLLAIDPVNNIIITKYLPVCGSGAIRVTDNNIWVSAHDINTVWV